MLSIFPFSSCSEVTVSTKELYYIGKQNSRFLLCFTLGIRMLGLVFVLERQFVTLR